MTRPTPPLAVGAPGAASAAAAKRVAESLEPVGGRRIEPGPTSPVTTALATAPYRQPVNEYVCPAHAARERQALFRERPLCIGASAMLPAPGSYFTDDLTGVGIDVVNSWC